MHQSVQIIDLDNAAKAVRKFFEKLGDEPVIVKHDGRAVYLIQPAGAVVADSIRLKEKLAGEVLQEVQGAWKDIPPETLDEIAVGNRAQAP